MQHRTGTQISVPTDPAAVVADVLARQAGVISRVQALAAGMSASAIDDRVRTRRWYPLHPRVYLERTHPHGPEARVRAAVLWAGPDAVLCGLAAAWWHGIAAEPPPSIVVAVPRIRGAHRARTGVAIRYHRHATTEVFEDRGLRLTVRGLSVLDGAVELGDRGAAFLDYALRSGVSLAELEAVRTASGSATATRLLREARKRWLSGWVHHESSPVLAGWRPVHCSWRDRCDQAPAVLAGTRSRRSVIGHHRIGLP